MKFIYEKKKLLKIACALIALVMVFGVFAFVGCTNNNEETIQCQCTTGPTGPYGSAGTQTFLAPQLSDAAYDLDATVEFPRTYFDASIRIADIVIFSTGNMRTILVVENSSGNTEFGAGISLSRQDGNDATCDCNTNGSANGLVYGFGDWDGQVNTWIDSNGVRYGLPFVEFGSYPRSYVGDALNTILEDAHSSLIRTGRSFITCSSPSHLLGVFAPHASHEYSFDDEYFVRVSIIRVSSSAASNTFNNTNYEIGANGTIRWMRIEPIRWLIANWQQLPTNINSAGTGEATYKRLVAAETVTGGIPFSTANEVLWENSIARSFLNNEFLNNAFCDLERTLIQNTNIPNVTSYGAEFGAGGTPTDDYVFLLSFSEFNNRQGSSFGHLFFNWAQPNSNSHRQIRVSDFAVANNTVMAGNHMTGYWWLRDAASPNLAITVSREGGISVTNPSGRIFSFRPALMLALYQA